MDVRSILRGRASDEPRTADALAAAIRGAVVAKPGGHCFDRPEEITEDAPMSDIGG